jgi:geranylgeranyl diphosphate synthase, type II
MDIISFLQNEKPGIEKHLFSYLEQLGIDGILYDSMEYSLKAGGKRIRPFLAIAVCELLKKDREIIIPYACALEFIHTYSLIHDDLPALDNDDMRRGKPSNHKKFGEAIGILAGDALNCDAFSILFEFGRGNIAKGGKYLAKASGGRGMVLGQVKDCIVPEKERNVEILDEINLLKTGALIVAATAGAAAWLDAEDQVIETLENYGKNIGLAFQIADDILDVTSDTKTLGKPVGSDAQLNKTTYPALLGVKESKALALQYASKAGDALNIFEESKWKQALGQLAYFVVERKS